MNRSFLFVAALVALTGCPKKDDKTTNPAPSASASVAAVPPASAAPSASAAPTNGAQSWSGTYTLAAGTLSIPSANPDYKGVKQAKDDPSKFMGDGKIDLAVDATGRVTGTVDGAAGPALVSGVVVAGEIRGQVRRQDPKDDGLVGTLSAKIAGDSADGNLSLASLGNAELVRDGKVSLKKK